MSKNYHYVIEINVPNGAKGWQEVVNTEMRKTITKLRVAVEQLGGKVHVRY